jgi:hypothetical protein
MSAKSDSPAAAEASTGEEHVGYRCPPVARRFQSGQSGNPRGRPKGARSVSSVIAAALSERVAVTENGQRRQISKLEASVKQLVNRAASGEFRATQLLLALAQANESRPAPQDEQRFSEDDAIVMRELALRLKGDDQ